MRRLLKSVRYDNTGHMRSTKIVIRLLAGEFRQSKIKRTRKYAKNEHHSAEKCCKTSRAFGGRRIVIAWRDQLDNNSAKPI